MILKQLAEGIRNQDWFVVMVEIMIVVVGIFIGLQVDDWNEGRNREARGARVLEAVRDDINDRISVQAKFGALIDAGLTSWEEAHSQGLTPAPYYFRVNGSETPPDGIWDTVTQEGLVDLMDPNLLFDLAFYYSEARGISLRYVRYAEFTEAEVLPWLGRNDETMHFYENEVTLKPMFKAHMERLQEYREQFTRLRSWEDCLLRRLETPQAASRACRVEDDLEFFGNLVPLAPTSPNPSDKTD